MIPLTRGLSAIVDDSDFAELNALKWHAAGNGYAVRSQRVKNGNDLKIFMHKVLLNAAPGQLVDHKDGDKLNNRRSNLRLADRAGNSMNRRRGRDNTTGLKGIVRRSRVGGTRWEASIRVNYKLVYLGMFEDRLAAAMAYDEAAKKLHGDFARPNFPNV